MGTPRLTITGEMPVQELEQIIASNASYFTDEDETKAMNYIDACAAYLAIPLSEIDHTGERARVEVRVIREGMQDAKRWLEGRRASRASGRKPVQLIPARDWNE